MSKPVIKQAEGGHWYDRDGNPKHDADLRVARKENLFVSPTTLESQQWKNPFIDQYKLDQLAEAAFESQRQPHDSLESYAQRIYELSRETSIKAAEFGQKIHKATEDYPQLPLDQSLMPWFLEFEKWYKENVLETVYQEEVLVDPDIGVAGRGDRCVILKDGKRALIDYKTQNVKTDAKGRKNAAFYPSFVRQLSFYAVADAKKHNLIPDIPLCISLVIDSNEGGLVYEKRCDPQEVAHAYQDFLCGAWLWFHGGSKRKPYWPVGYWEPFSVTRPDL